MELGALIDLVAGYVQTPSGRKLALQLHPSADRDRIESAIGITAEAADYLRTGARFGLGGIEDPEPALEQLPVEGTALDPHQILILERLIAVGLDLHDLFRKADLRERYPNLSRLASGIPDLGRLLAGIRGKILPGGEISDDASPELKVIRREMQDSRTRIHRHLESIMRGESRAVQEELVTFRNGRFVIPIRTDSRNLVPGVVHGLSGSGQTTFVEPLAVIDQNNELVRLREREEFEIARILLSITDSLRANFQAVKATAGVMAEFDLAQAKGRFSLEFRCVRPTLATGSDLLLADTRHVLLEQALRHSNGAVVPISLELDDAHYVLVISGPNAGGKTVVLKTVGLAAVMTQMGLHVPAREARLPVFGQIFADIGDQQSIAANLSTFTAHMRNVSEMARAVTPPALVLIDEVGTGTDPDEGSALAVAIVEHFRQTGATTIVTTHYNGLKIWASQAESVRNASVEFDERSLRPTYRLILGVAGASAGLEIARRMDVPGSILDSAHGLIDRDQLQAGEYLKRLKAAADEQQALIAALEEERQAAAEKYSSLEEVFAKREAARRVEFDNALSRALEEFKVESDRLIQSLRERAEAERLRRAAANRAAELRRVSDRLRAQTQKSGALQPSQSSDQRAIADRTDEIREGDRVRVLSLSREGTIETVHENGFTVRIGALRYRADREDVALIASLVEEVKGSGVQITATGADVDSEVPSEINVIGMTADDARSRVDKFLDEAFLANKESVRIIHGHGKGILRRAIANLLTGHPQVERFSTAPPEQGGGGATIAELKK